MIFCCKFFIFAFSTWYVICTGIMTLLFNITENFLTYDTYLLISKHLGVNLDQKLTIFINTEAIEHSLHIRSSILIVH